MGIYESGGLFCVGKPKGYKWSGGFDSGKILLSEVSLSFFPSMYRRQRWIFQYNDNKFELPLYEIAEIETITRRMFKYLEIHTTTGNIYSFWPLNITGNPSGKKRKELENALIERVEESKKALIEKIEETKKALIEKNEETKKEIIKKMSQFFRVSDRLNLRMMRNILTIEQSDFDDIIFDWCEKFDFSIEGDTLIINNKEKIPDFIDYLKNELVFTI